jgi:hypothetical protein
MSIRPIRFYTAWWTYDVQTVTQALEESITCEKNTVETFNIIFQSSYIYLAFIMSRQGQTTLFFNKYPYAIRPHKLAISFVNVSKSSISSELATYPKTNWRILRLKQDVSPTASSQALLKNKTCHYKY